MAERDRSPAFHGFETNQDVQIVLPDDNDQVLVCNFAPGTYVVKVPKDQIYRVPPPENALIFESDNKKPAPTKKDPCRFCCCCFCVLLMLLILLIVVGAVLGALFAVLLRPKDPRFSVHRLQFRKTINPPQYVLNLEVHNPNPNIDIFYEKGDASLLSRHLEIASGVYPNFCQKSKNTTMVKIVFEGVIDILPKEIRSSGTNKKTEVPVSFSLEMKLPTRMKLGLLHSRTMDFKIKCRITVDTSAKDTRILSQECARVSRG